MFIWLFEYLQGIVPGNDDFHYLILRAVMAAMSSLLLTLVIAPLIIKKLTLAQVGQVIRQDGPESHFLKSGTPTMGGILILITMTVSILMWARLKNVYMWIALFSALVFGCIGWVDDYRKLVRKDTKGLIVRWKFFWQSVFSLSITMYLFFIAKTPVETSLLIPCVKDTLPIGAGFIVLGYFVIVSTSNAVNLSDGLDGLAIMPVVIISCALGIFSYISGNVNFSSYLSLPYIPGTQELVICCASLVGAGLGFLWFNAYPALIFMGDVGALSLGAMLGSIAIMVRQELVFFIMTGVFVVETLSVILQILFYKLTKKRIFKMAPIHHHFELLGWPESRVIIRFWVVTIILVLLGLATIKLR